jgi:hypothetical protein
MDGLRGNVVPHRMPQVHLLVVSMESTGVYWKPGRFFEEHLDGGDESLKPNVYSCSSLTLSRDAQNTAVIQTGIPLYLETQTIALSTQGAAIASLPSQVDGNRISFRFFNIERKSSRRTLGTRNAYC